MLMINQNPLRRLRKDAFKGLSHLGFLLTPAGIEIIESGAFGGMNNVEILKLSSLNLTNFNAKLFEGTQSVKSLQIEESQLGKVCKHNNVVSRKSKQEPLVSQ